MNDTKTLKLTLQQLNERIAREFGWYYAHDNECWFDGGIELYCHQEVPDYTGDMNLATELLGELPNPSLDKNYEEWFSCAGKIEGSLISRSHSNPAVAICLAWLQWKTGEVVEL